MLTDSRQNDERTRLSPFLVAKQDFGLAIGDQVCKCLDQKRERWFEIDTIGSQDQIWVRYVCWYRFSPFRVASIKRSIPEECYHEPIELCD